MGRAAKYEGNVKVENLNQSQSFLHLIARKLDATDIVFFNSNHFHVLIHT